LHKFAGAVHPDVISFAIPVLFRLPGAGTRRRGGIGRSDGAGDLAAREAVLSHGKNLFSGFFLAFFAPGPDNRTIVPSSQSKQGSVSDD